MANHSKPPETINNVYELPITEPTIKYIHAAAGFLEKSMWLKAIQRLNYLTWTLINTKNVTKFFFGSEETQKWHMRGQRQGVRSIKSVEPDKAAVEYKINNQHDKRHDILIAAYDMKNTMYTDQTGKFPHRCSQGSRYHIIIHNIGRSYTWVEPINGRTEG